MKRFAFSVFMVLLLMAAMGIFSPNFAGSDPRPVGHRSRDIPDLSMPNYTNSPLLRKFIDSLPGLGYANQNNLGQYIPVAVPDTTMYPGSDYYEMGVVQYGVQMHSDLVNSDGTAHLTKLRGYKQLNAADPTVGVPQYLGPLIMAHRDRPVRVKLTNLLPTGMAGNLFLPVDPTVMGAGMGPYGMDVPIGDMNYSQNRATFHLHGGFVPWISDGTAHQWTTPAGEVTAYPKGVSAQDVPDMPPTGPGEMTFYYPNQQSGRLMFYHDHAWGITRLNVYAGEAAGYLLMDPQEEALIAQGVIPADQVPLIIQDKTFVPDDQTLATTDPLWDTTNWGQLGDLWYPHVYMPNQDPNSPNGMNSLGRWDYGPWIWPPAPVTADLPHPSAVMEAYMDTPIINGTAYPYATVEPKAYRFRILNACNDRFLNLQLYYADPAYPGGTEVAMVPTCGYAMGTPDPAYAGPTMVQIGTEGGVLPYPAVLNNPPVPIGWDTDPKSITVGNVNRGNLILGPAERADVIIDFSGVPVGSKLILYNDAPAAFPAPDPRYDYYTGDPDNTVTGGAPSTLPGYGPNTRTLMQIRVEGIPAGPFDFNRLNTEIPALYAATQDPPLMMQMAYNAAFPGQAIGTDTYPRIHDTTITMNGVDYTFQSKAIAEEFDPVYGRMSAMLGTEWWVINGQGQQTNGFGFVDPATETIAGDETQVWKITHNGVDTHTIHWHFVNVQVLARVDWAGVVKAPDPNEVGWKETLRVSPLEDTFVAVRAKLPSLPFAVPTSNRLLNPSMPLGSTMGFTNPWPYTGLPTVNEVTNFGWEYVWHCHILGHEEMDMMRPLVVEVNAPPPNPPAAPSNLGTAITNPPLTVVLTWLDNATNETGFTVQRAVDANFTQQVTQFGIVGADFTTYSDISVMPDMTYYYRVRAYNGDGPSDWSNTSPATTPPPLTPPLAPDGLTAVADPTSEFAPTVTLNWNDNSTNEDGFIIERALDAGFNQGLVQFTVAANTIRYVDGPLNTHTTYYYRVRAFNLAGQSANSNVAAVQTNGWLPAAPSNLIVVSTTSTSVTLSWTDNAPNETDFLVQRRPWPFLLWQNSGTTNANVTTITVTGLRRNTRFQFRVEARNADGNSTWSNVVEGRTLP